MSNRSIATPRNAGIGAVSAPVLLVGVLAMLHHVAEPHSSVADVQPPQDPDSIVASLVGGVSAAQQEAMRFCESLPELDADASPFPIVEVGAPSIDELLDPNSGSLDESMDALSGLLVTAMIASKSGNIALINGKAQRVGDDLIGGWKVKSIDAQDEIVVLVSPDGKEHALKIDRTGSVR